MSHGNLSTAVFFYPQKYGRPGNSMTHFFDSLIPYITKTQ